MKWLMETVLSLGADHGAELSPEQIPLDPAFRDACKQNACGYYGRCWTCPPDAGNIRVLMGRVRSYRHALVFQTISKLEDSYDIEGMHEASLRHNALVNRVRDAAVEKLGKNCMVLGAGACGVCGVCAKAENLPCRFPNKAVVSMEACGVNVSELARVTGLKYINGVNTVTYFGMLLYDGDAMMRIRTGAGERTAVCRFGQTIGKVLQDAGIPFELPCSGRGICGKCRVLAEGALSVPNEEEKAALGGETDSRVRLACQARVNGDCTVTLPEEGRMQFAPEERHIGLPAAPMYRKLGAAVDIGTTTLAVQLFDQTGCIASAADLNPQGAYGADVITRVGRAMEGEGPALQKAVVGAISALLEKLVREKGYALADLDAMTLTGNTAMLYLLTGRNPKSLSRSPFAADCLFGETVSAQNLGFPFSADCYLPRCMAAFVGADITTALLASGMLKKPGTGLLVDVGTNGEMALWHGGRLTCCSTAAGPAFEGTMLSCGCRGETGAIDRVTVADGKLCCHTIGDGAPTGVCGSGVVDAMAALLELEWLDETGRLEVEETDGDGQPIVRLDGPVTLSQKDVRYVQLAKSAICAGLRTLVKDAGLREKDVERFYIAGGFGAFLNTESAARIGLIPAELAGKARVIGNGALTGAAMLLTDRTLVEETLSYAGMAEHIELSTNAFFQEQYIEDMMFE